MKSKPKSEGEKLLCPKACVLNQLDDDRPSDRVVLETKKATDSTMEMLLNSHKNPYPQKATANPKSQTGSLTKSVNTVGCNRRLHFLHSLVKL